MWLSFGVLAPVCFIITRYFLFVCHVLLMLWGHKPVHTVTLWGLTSLMGTKPLHFSVMTWFKVRVRLRVRLKLRLG